MRLRRASVLSSLVSAGALTGILILDPGELMPWGFPTAAGLVVAFIITSRLPRHPIGWLLMTFATTSSVGAFALTLALYATDPTTAGWLDAIGNAVNTAGVLALPVILLRFPEGSLLGRRWRLAEFAAVAASALGFTAALLNGGWGGDILQAVVVSPLYQSTTPLGDNLSTFFYLLMATTMITAAISLILRFRRAHGDDRLRIKWLAYAGGFLIVTFGILMTTTGGLQLNSAWQIILAAFAFSLIPVAVGIAVLKYRLYDIDLVINRTVVLGLLAIFITVVYAGVVVGLGTMIGGHGDGVALPIAATAIVAVAFEPFRHLAQRWANRLVYGQRSTPYEVLSVLTERLSEAEAGEGMLLRIASLLKDGTGAEQATVWLGEGDVMRPVATWPADATPRQKVDFDSESTFTVRHDGEVVGALELNKPRGTALSSSERNLVDDLAGSVGMVLGYQRLNDSLADSARQVEESRHRLVEAQDQERRRLERDLHDGAQQQLVALKLKIGIARSMSAKHGTHDLEKLLATLGDEAQLALEEIRALAKGIYPPVLVSDGLSAAVSSLAASAPVQVHMGGNGIARYPADVEAAVYFNISEAVTNAIKHGSPPVRVDLVDDQGTIRFEVTDSGGGFDISQTTNGSGMNNMADRLDALGGKLTVLSEIGGGTTIRGEIPVSTSPGVVTD